MKTNYLTRLALKALRVYNSGRLKPTSVNSLLEGLIFYSFYGRFSNFRNPSTWYEFIVNKKLYGDFDQLASVSDKWIIRNYVREKLGEEYLTNMIDVVDNIHDIDEERYLNYPEQFVAKPNMASKRVYINKTRNYPVFKQKISSFFDEFGNRNNEFQYKIIPKKLLIEEWLNPHDEPLQEIKCWTFHGRVELMAHSLSVYEGEKNDTYKFRLYNRNWEEPPVQFRTKLADVVKKPRQLEEIIRISETLADGWDFIRVDWYLADGKLKFGELTPTPSAGRSFFFNLEDQKFVFNNYVKKD